MKKVFFSVGSYDNDGNALDNDIRLHFGNVSVKIGDTLFEFEQFVDQLDRMRRGIRETIANHRGE